MFTDYYGDNFNKLSGGKKFYRFLPNNLTHHGYKFKLGVNNDIVIDQEGYSCSTGALFFYEESKCRIFLRYYDRSCKLAIVKIPDNARVFVEENRFMADTFDIEDILDFDKIPADFWISVVGEEFAREHFINKPSHTLPMEANETIIEEVVIS